MFIGGGKGIRSSIIKALQRVQEQFSSTPNKDKQPPSPLNSDNSSTPTDESGRLDLDLHTIKEASPEDENSGFDDIPRVGSSFDDAPSSPRSEHKSLSRHATNLSLPEHERSRIITSDASFYHKNEVNIHAMLGSNAIDPELSILQDNAASQQAGIPIPVTDIIAKTCEKYGIALTIRSTIIGGDTPQQYYKGKFSAKNTNIHTKSTKFYCPTRGWISKFPERFEEAKAKDLTDHQETSFPKEAKNLSLKYMKDYLKKLGVSVADNIEDIELKLEFLRQYAENHQELILDPMHNETLVDVKTVDGKLCFAIQRDTYRFAKLDSKDKNGTLIRGEVPAYILQRFKDGETTIEHNSKVFIRSGEKIFVKLNEKNIATGQLQPMRQVDHYIQSSEGLLSVLDGYRKGYYKLIGFIEGTHKLKYQSYETGMVYCIDLAKLTENESPPDRAEIERTKREGAKPNIWTKEGFTKDSNSDIANIIAFLSPKLRDELMVYIDLAVTGNDDIPVFELKNGVEVPILVVSEPYPVTNDFDLGHMALPKPPALPDEAYKIYDLFSIEGRKELKSAALKMLRTLGTLKSQYPQATQLRELLEIGPSGKSYIELCFEAGAFSRMGAMSLGEFLYICALNKDIDPTGELRIIPHGCESKNPLMGQAKPEPFGAMLHIHDGKKTHTNDEQSCINFYLFNDTYMRDRYIEVHPYWLRERNAEETHLIGVWMDIIRYQALNGWDATIRLSVENMKAKYPVACKKIMNVLKEMKAIKGEQNRKQAAAAILAKYKDGFNGDNLVDFNKFSKISMAKSASAKLTNRKG